MDSRWRPIPMGWGDLYEVSDVGEVRTLTSRRGSPAGRLLTPKRGTRGYLHVDLARDGRKARYGIHRLVAEAFLGPAPSAQHHPNHLNGRKDDNRVANLAWATPGENNSHALALGLRDVTPLPGARNGRAKLTAEQVQEIRRRAAAGETQRDLAAVFGVSKSQIGNIARGERWPDEWPPDLRVREWPETAVPA